MVCPMANDIVSLDEERFRTWMERQSLTSLLCKAWGDDAVRASEIVNTAVVNGFVGFWIAIRLSDGGSDEIAYPTKRDAIRNQLHEQQCVYVKLPPDGMAPKAARSYLDIHRQLYDAGLRIADPDDPRRGVILPQ